MHLGRVCDKWYIFSCMIGSRISWIISVICGQDQQVIFPQFIQQSSKSLIELLNLMTIPFRISSVSPQCIKIYQIYKTQPMKIFCTDFCCLLHPLDRTVRMIGFCDSLTTENIIDLSNTDHIQPCILQCVQSCSACWFEGIIMTVAGSLKFPFFLSDIRSCNDSSNSPLIFKCQFSGNLTAAIQIGKIKCFLISTNLQYRVSRGIYDHRTCIDFLFTKFFNDLCSTCTLISNDTFAASFLKFIDQFLGKSGFCKGFKWFLCIDSHHFPMSGHRILAIASFRNPHITSQRFLYAFHSAAFMQIQHSKLLKIRNIQFSHFIQDMTKGIHTFITKFFRIRHRSDSK